MINRSPLVLMGLQFFPRGGSAHLAAGLAGALPATGWSVRIACGSVGTPGQPGEARTFYAGLDVHPVDMTAAMTAPDPMLASPPLHPSYEDRPGAPDRIFAALDDGAYHHQVAAWTDALQAAGAAQADVLHLHHLTPLHAAAHNAAPSVPVVGHLHGTELLMLEAIEHEPGRWPHADEWTARLRAWAAACARIILISPSQVERAAAVLGVGTERCVWIPNGFDTDRFRALDIERVTFWRRQLVKEPRGWSPGEQPGSVRYTDADLAAFADGAPVLLFVGRFTAVKRLSVLVEAYARARAELARRAPLVILGGFPGEWEGEHPLDAVRRTATPDVFLAGWHEHDALPDFFAASDVVVLPSVREQFGQVLVEGMACGLPAIAVDALGSAEIVDDGRTGWLVPGDDVAALAAAMVEAVNRPSERRRRGAAASADARRRFAWPALAARVADVYAELTA